MADRKKIISEALLRIFNLYVENQKRPRNYGIAEQLYPGEVHLIMLIMENPGATASELAKRGGVTRGAVSQTIQKLAKKELIRNSKDLKDGQKNTLEVTNKGKIAYYSHADMHEKMDKVLFEFLESLDYSQMIIIEQFLRLVELGILKRSET